MANDSIQIEYNETLSGLQKLLGQVKRPGSFWVSGTVEAPMPKVEVEGAGVLSFPVPAAQAEDLTRKATRAPNGRNRVRFYAARTDNARIRSLRHASNPTTNYPARCCANPDQRRTYICCRSQPTLQRLERHGKPC